MNYELTALSVRRDYLKHYELANALKRYAGNCSCAEIFVKLGIASAPKPEQNILTPVRTTKTHHIRRILLDNDEVGDLVLWRKDQVKAGIVGANHYTLDSVLLHSSYPPNKFKSEVLDRLLEGLQNHPRVALGSPIKLSIAPPGRDDLKAVKEFMAAGEHPGMLRTTIQIHEAMKFTGSKTSRIPDQVLSAGGDFGANRRNRECYSFISFRLPRSNDLHYGRVLVSSYSFIFLNYQNI